MSPTSQTPTIGVETVSPLTLSHTLLELAERADRAGFTVSAGRLLALAHSVCSDKPGRSSRARVRRPKAAPVTAPMLVHG